MDIFEAAIAIFACTMCMIMLGLLAYGVISDRRINQEYIEDVVRDMIWRCPHCGFSKADLKKPKKN